MKKNYLFGILLLILTTSVKGQYTLNSTRRMSPGVKYMEYSTSSPARKIFVLEVDLTDPTIRLQVVKSGDKINGPAQSVSTMFNANDAWAYHDVSGGINGDFFTINSTYQNPINTLVNDGEVMWNYASARSIFGISDNNIPFIGNVDENFTVIANGITKPFSLINRGRSTNALVLYNRLYGNATATNTSGTELKIVPVAGVNGWKANGAIQCKVLEKQVGIGNMSYTDGQAVLSGHGTSQTYLNGINVNDIITVNLTIAPGASNLLQVTGAKPRIVNNGVNYAAQGIINEGDASGSTREPRTGLGYKQDNSKLYMVVVDGRTTASVGMTMSELANFLIYLGCYQGVNLDGGGSSTMVANGQLKNAPSDGAERLVASVLLVYVNTKTLDDFEAGVGHFNRAPTYAQSTVGVSTSSTATIATTAHSGFQSLQVKLVDNTSTTTPWMVRLLSGTGDPSNNRSFSGGTLSFWMKTSTAASGAKLRLWIDDSDGLELSPYLNVINDGNWHKYTWSLDNYNGTAPTTGNGEINSSAAHLDAIEFSQPNTSATWTSYIDDILHDKNGTVSSLASLQSATSFNEDNLSASLNNNDELLLYPNPNKGSFEIDFKNPLVNKFDMKILTASGAEVFSKSFSGSKHAVNVDHLSNGLYFVKIQSNEYNQTFKIIVNKD